MVGEMVVSGGDDVPRRGQGRGLPSGRLRYAPASAVVLVRGRRRGRQVVVGGRGSRREHPEVADGPLR